jgi:hypothetical protein
VVGKAPAQRFTVYTDFLDSRSGFFKAARKPEWTEPTKPTCLEDEGPLVFSRYLNCVYFGVHALSLGDDAPENDREPLDPKAESKPRPDAFDCSCSEQAAPYAKYHLYVQQCFLTLAEVYLLADRLQDLETSDLIIDEFRRFVIAEGIVPQSQICRLVYESTVHGHPFRKLMRDYCVYGTSGHDYMNVYHSSWPLELTRDVTAEFLRLMNCSKNDAVILVGQVADFKDACRYHQHSKEQPCYLSGPHKGPRILPADGEPATEPSVTA